MQTKALYLMFRYPFVETGRADLAWVWPGRALCAASWKRNGMKTNFNIITVHKLLAYRLIMVMQLYLLWRSHVLYTKYKYKCLLKSIQNFWSVMSKLWNWLQHVQVVLKTLYFNVYHECCSWKEVSGNLLWKSRCGKGYLNREKLNIYVNYNNNMKLQNGNSKNMLSW